MTTQLLRLSAPAGPSPTSAGNPFLRAQTTPFIPTSAVSFPAASPPPGFSLSLSLLRARSTASGQSPFASDLAGGGGDGVKGNGRGGSGGGGGFGGGAGGSTPPDLGPLGIFVEGWRSRVSADPQFPFKVFMEEIVGVSACALGDMASRPNFGLNELDFVFSTLVVGSIVNFLLMYLLAPTAGATSAALPGLFASCPAGHMFEPGAFSVANRLGTFLYKGSTFACVGFAAGLAGTAISNGLISLRKKMDPAFESPNKPPPTVLNALTWAIHMGLSSNLRYQTLNGVEFLLARSALPSAAFKSSILVLRCLNNVLGGVSFVTLARLTGSQKTEDEDQNETKMKLLSDREAAAELETSAAEEPVGQCK